MVFSLVHDRHRVRVEAVLAPRHLHEVLPAHRLLPERLARRVVRDRVGALLRERDELRRGLDREPLHLGRVDPVDLRERGEELPLRVARRRRQRLALEVLRLHDAGVLAGPDVERGEVEHRADDLDLRPLRDARDHDHGVRQSEIGAVRVDLGDRVSGALRVLQLDVEPLRLVIALVEGDPVRGVVADGEPVEREHDLLRRLRVPDAGDDGRRDERPADQHGAFHGVSFLMGPPS